MAERKTLLTSTETKSDVDADLLKKAIEGDQIAQYNLGCQFEKGKDYKSAAVWYEESAKQGYANAQNNLGCLYEKGLGVTKNTEQAIYWYREAADQNYPISQINLALHLKKSESTLTEAAKLMHSAARQDEPVAIFELGLMIMEGKGVRQDIFLGLQHIKLAAKKDYWKAQYNYADVLIRMSESKNKTMAEEKFVNAELIKSVKLLQRAAQAGYGKAQRLLGYCFEKGIGVTKDPIQAKYWKQQAILPSKFETTPFVHPDQHVADSGVSLSESIKKRRQQRIG